MTYDPEYEWTKRLLDIVKRLDIGLSSTIKEEAPKLTRLRRKFVEHDDFISGGLKRKLQADGLTIITDRRT